MTSPMTSILLEGDSEEVITCPYNKSHQIIRKRMQFHLVKCKKNYPNFNTVECIYNSVHKVPEPEIKFHLETCPDRRKIDKIYYRKENSEDALKKYPIQNQSVVTSESWDNVVLPTYEPDKKCEKAPILRQLNVESAAKRRNFRYAERRRLQSLGHVKQPLKLSERERAADFAQRLDGSTGAKNPLLIVDDNDPIAVTSLLERIKLGSLPIRPMSDRVRAQLEETDDTDASAPDVERWQMGGTRPNKGIGRGKFIKKTGNDGN